MKGSPVDDGVGEELSVDDRLERHLALAHHAEQRVLQRQELRREGQGKEDQNRVSRRPIRPCPSVKPMCVHLVGLHVLE